MTFYKINGKTTFFSVVKKLETNENSAGIHSSRIIQIIDTELLKLLPSFNHRNSRRREQSNRAANYFHCVPHLRNLSAAAGAP